MFIHYNKNLLVMFYFLIIVRLLKCIDCCVSIISRGDKFHHAVSPRSGLCLETGQRKSHEAEPRTLPCSSENHWCMLCIYWARLIISLLNIVLCNFERSHIMTYRYALLILSSAMHWYKKFDLYGCYTSHVAFKVEEQKHCWTYGFSSSDICEAIVCYV